MMVRTTLQSPPDCDVCLKNVRLRRLKGRANRVGDGIETGVVPSLLTWRVPLEVPMTIIAFLIVSLLAFLLAFHEPSVRSEHPSHGRARNEGIKIG
jgi:hypothetical protein